MERYRGYLAVFIVTTALVAVPVSLAFKGGADPGYSGGRAADGANCTACHVFNLGTGRVEILKAPVRYRAGAVYDLTVRISDPDPVQDGAGFEISAETVDGVHEGTLHVTDAAHTWYSSAAEEYVTHRRAGVDDSIAEWLPSRSYDYNLEWEAPGYDAGPITLFAASLSVDTDSHWGGVRYYATHATSHYAKPGDFDGDGDLDLDDHMRFAGCFSGPGVPSAEGCEDADTDGDGDVDLEDAAAFQATFTGPTATLPPGYVLTDQVRGGRLYDKWWAVNGAAEPTGDHPLYPDGGPRSGSTTYRCKECHGWDYKGRDGAYGTGSSHFTDIIGVQSTLLTPQQLFDLLKSPDDTAGGHNMAAYGMGDRDLWDVVNMTLEGVIETDDYIDGTGAFIGDEFSGDAGYNSICTFCHDEPGSGDQGDALNFGSPEDPEYVGTVANGNPWEFLHKIRFGQPASPMPSLELLGWAPDDMADLGAFAATLRE